MSSVAERPRTTRVAARARLWLCSFDYPPRDGGIARLCAEIVTAYARRGTDVRVLSEVGAEAPGTDVPPLPEVRVTRRRGVREWRAFRALARSRDDGPVICSVWYPEGLLAMLARRRPRVVLAYGHELMPTRAWWRRRLWARLRRWVLESADLVVGCSDYTRRLVLDVAPRARAVGVPLAVDHERFTPGDRDAAKASFDVAGRFVISTVARVHRFKGHDVVLRAIAALPTATRERVVYLVAGRGPDLPQLQALAAQLGVGDQVRWLGYVPEARLVALYRASDLFALCTREQPGRQEVEGFGLVFLEAQACGTPVVGTRAGGIPDAVTDGDGGWLIPTDDADALSHLIARGVAEPAWLAESRRAARARVERDWTWAQFLERFDEALDTAGLHVG